ncbi:MAG TPA: MmcQ/YjbR family DNA-binding protein [Caulobacteraceae bacterium]|jgi:hypothetical protein
MLGAADVRRLAVALPDAVDETEGGALSFTVGGKGFAWAYLVRTHPKKPRVLDLGVLAVRCPIERKELLIEAAPDIYFDDDHYRGYPAVLVRLDTVEEAELAALLAAACALQASARPKRKKS